MFFKEKKILIIGGTGTIGQNLIRFLLEEEPEEIRIFSRDEFKQYHLQHTLKGNKKIRFCIGDVREYASVLAAMQDIDYAFHVAAMKHVASCEQNPYEAVLTNIMGTNNVIKAAMEQQVEKVVFTSSDKAVSPTNTYGATKLTAERLISAAEQKKGNSKTVFASVRFGNVMGSRGSVIPLFTEQILKDKRITVTNKKMSRFMMSLTQATMLTMEALKEAQGGEVFILKMPVIVLETLSDVVIEEVAHKNGLDPSAITIEEIGLKPGEKMYEELMTLDESAVAYELPNMYIIPGLHSKMGLYSDAKKAALATYSSDDQHPLMKEELRSLLNREKLV
ncbi:MAG: SDR family NAD(P)-dependent oxidoreductase [Bacillus sp. (in: firmicutes)]